MEKGWMIEEAAYDYNDEYHSPRDTERLHSYVVYKDEKAAKRVLGQKTREQVRAVLDNPGTWKDSGSFEYAMAAPAFFMCRRGADGSGREAFVGACRAGRSAQHLHRRHRRSEEHTSELQSH